MRQIKVVDWTCGKKSSDDVNTNIPFEKAYAETKSIQQANVVIAAYLNKNLKDMDSFTSVVYLYNDNEVTYEKVIQEYLLNKIIFVKDEHYYYVLSDINSSNITFDRLGTDGDLSETDILLLSSSNVWSKSGLISYVATSERNGLMSSDNVIDIDNIKDDIDGIDDDIESINDNLDTIEDDVDIIEDKLDGVKPMGSIIVDNVTGKNIFNKDEITFNSRVNTETGEIYTTSNYSVSNYIEVDGNVSYALTTESSGYEDVYYAWYTKNKVFISGGLWTNKTSWPAPNNAKYLRFDFLTANVDEVQLEKSYLATSYAPYNKFGYNSIDSMGNIVVDNIQSKNLFNYTLLKSTTNQGITWTNNNDGTITISGTSNGSTTRSQTTNNTLKAGTYTMSISNTLDFVLKVRAYKSGGGYQYFSIPTGEKSRTVTFEVDIINYDFYMDTLTNGQQIDKTFSLQIEKGETATNYTSYQLYNYNPYYAVGDTYTGVNAYACGIGSFLTSSIRTICFDVIVPKLLTNITTITITALRIRCRSLEGTYLLTGSSKYADVFTNTDSGGDPLAQSCTGIVANKISDNQIRIQVTFDDAIYTTNNIPVATEFRNLNMTFS